MSDIEIKNAVIEAATISTKERGILECWLTLDYGGSGQGFGGHALYLPKSFAHHRLESVAGHHIYRIMQVAGVDSWDEVVGKTIRVKASWNSVHAIGHIVKDDWFCPDNDYRQFVEAQKGRS